MGKNPIVCFNTILKMIHEKKYRGGTYSIADSMSDPLLYKYENFYELMRKKQQYNIKTYEKYKDELIDKIVFMELIEKKREQKNKTKKN